MTEHYGPMTVVRGPELSADTAQSSGALRLAGVDQRIPGVSSIWMGRVSNEPGYKSVAHHHGDAQTAGFVLKGQARLYFGPAFDQSVDLDEGDFVFVPPNWPHIEANRSTDQELVWLTARSPDNIVVNLED